jgi:hypothetical protein
MEWYWWAFVAVVLALLVIRWIIPVHKNPAHKLGKQAAEMGWVASGTSKDARGYRNLKVSKYGVQAVISFEKQRVLVVDPAQFETFKDFVELEAWLKPLRAEAEAAVREKSGDLYHALLDTLTAECAASLRRQGLHAPHGWPAEVHAEAIVYLACYCAKFRRAQKFSIAGWNTFKSSVENRMTGIREAASSRGGSNTTSLVSSVSGYHAYLTEREKLAAPAHEGSFELADRLLTDIEAPEVARASWREYFASLVGRAERDVLEKVWMCVER